MLSFNSLHIQIKCCSQLLKAGKKFLNSYIIGAAYVGLATIAGFIWWFIYSDSGPKLPYAELVRFYLLLSSYGIVQFIPGLSYEDKHMHVGYRCKCVGGWVGGGHYTTRLFWLSD